MKSILQKQILRIVFNEEGNSTLVRALQLKNASIEKYVNPLHWKTIFSIPLSLKTSSPMIVKLARIVISFNYVHKWNADCWIALIVADKTMFLSNLQPVNVP